jgi:hypothetical protein
MGLKEYHNELEKISSTDDLKKIIKSTKGMLDAWIALNFNEILSKFPFETPEQGLIIRHLALKIKPAGDFSEDIKKECQRYWLGCCYNSKCDYDFALYRELEIDRENDIIALWSKSILFQNLSAEGKAYYRDVCMKFLLRRYSLCKAMKLWEWKGFFGINLFLPRLMGAILIGFIPLIMAEEIWKAPSKLFISDPFIFCMLTTLFLIGSYIYLFIECRNTIGKVPIRDLIWRPFRVFFYGIVISLGLSSLIVHFLSPHVPEFSKNDIFLSYPTILLFASAALLIGIFIQVFWEEKTITEPL